MAPSTRKPHFKWDADVQYDDLGEDGEDGEVVGQITTTPYSLLVENLEARDISDWKGKGSKTFGGARNKKSVDLAHMLRGYGVEVTGEQVLSKLARIEADFKSARAWRRQTGQGIMDGAPNEEDDADGYARVRLQVAGMETCWRKFEYSWSDSMCTRAARSTSGLLLSARNKQLAVHEQMAWSNDANTMI